MIGIFDSGVGGLTVAREIFKALPQYKIIYFGDTARMPYGTKSKKTIEKYAIEDAQFLLNKGAKIIVIACHTASALAADALRKKFPYVPIFDVVGPGVKSALKITRNNKIGVIGTSSTIASRVHENLLRKFNPKIKVVSQACPLLVPLIEEGWLKNPETRRIAKKYLRPLKSKQIDALILACTHYPLLGNILKYIKGKKMVLVDPAFEVASEIREFLKNKKGIAEQLSKSIKHEFYASDLPYKFQKISKQCLDKEVKVKQVDIFKYI